MGDPVVPAEFDFTTPSGERRTIRAIPRDELPAYRLLGSGANVNFGLAFFSGTLHVPDFTERVVGFLVRPDKNAELLDEIVGVHYLHVDFYEPVSEPIDFRPMHRICPACIHDINPECEYCNGTGVQVESACVYGGYLSLNYVEGCVCPQCGKADEVVPIVYGLSNEPMLAAVRAGLAVCGFCVLYEDSASAFCKRCTVEF